METNIIKIVSLIDPSTMDYVNDRLQEGYNSGELNISLPDTDQTIRGSWELQYNPSTKFNNCLSFNLLNQNDYDKLEDSFKSII